MITVLAEKRDNRSVKAVIELPATNGQLNDLYEELEVGSDSDYKIRYSGSGQSYALDKILMDNNYIDGLSVHELNLLSYLMDRMDDDQFADFGDIAMDYHDDLFRTEIGQMINEAYKTLAGVGEDEDFEIIFDGDNISELIAAERALLKPYPEMNASVFWQMIGEARTKYGDFSEGMEHHLTQELARMSPRDILLYKDIMDEYILLADTEDIYKASSELSGGRLGDDSFNDFRCWLISQGKDVYMSALKNPDFLADMNLKPINGYYEWESFHYIGSYAFKANTGESLYDKPPVITDEQKNEIIASANEDEAPDEDIGEDQGMGGIT